MGERGAKKHPADEAFCQRLVERLGEEAIPGLGYRSMFGGFGLFASSGMFGIVSKGALYLKADDVNRDRFVQAGSRQHRPMPYWEVPQRVLESTRSLRTWAIAAAEAAARAGSAKKRTRSPKATERKK